MRRLAVALLALSVLLGGARLFTGILYLSDEATAVLVLKQRPAAWIERPEAADLPFRQQIVLDSDELSLVYGRPYVALMEATPVLVPMLWAAAAFVLAAARRRRGRRPR